MKRSNPILGIVFAVAFATTVLAVSFPKNKINSNNNTNKSISSILFCNK